MELKRTWRLYGWLLLASVGVALVPSLFPQVDLAVAGYFLNIHPELNVGQWWWVDTLNEYTPTASRVAALLCLPLSLICRFKKTWRRWAYPIAFVGLSMTLGPGLLTAVVKEGWGRARPFHVTQFNGEKQFTPAYQPSRECTENCAFVSGHAACGFFLSTLMLVDHRRRRRWLGIGLTVGLGESFCRVAVGAHWLSDVLWAYPVTLVAGAMVWAMLRLFNQRGKAVESVDPAYRPPIPLAATPAVRLKWPEA